LILSFISSTLNNSELSYETKLSKLYKVGRDKCQTFSDDEIEHAVHTQFISMGSDFRTAAIISIVFQKILNTTGLEVTVKQWITKV